MYLDQLALELYSQVRVMGWDMVAQLRTLRLTRTQAYGLLARMQWLTGYLEQVRQAQTELQ